MITLLMSSRPTEDGQSLWRAAINRGWSVERARGIRLPELETGEIIIYVEAMFAPTIAKMLGRRLLEPPEDWLVKLPLELTRRRVTLTTLGDARGLSQPAFVKPPNDKSFAAQVYPAGAALPLEYDDSTPVLVSEPLEWLAEFRCFCLDGKVRTLSPYLRSGVLAKESNFTATSDELRAATAFAERVLVAASGTTPRAVVIDVGQFHGPEPQDSWAVVEANAAWGSGIYGCDPNAVLDVVRQATVQPQE